MKTEQQEIDIYGADAADWLARWDAGQTVWTIEMGGLGPGYEQALQICAAEMLRWFVANQPEEARFQTEEAWEKMRDAMDAVIFAEGQPCKGLGLSGAQVGAARNLASYIYRHGPRHMMNDPAVKDRHILVSRTFPGAAA